MTPQPSAWAPSAARGDGFQVSRQPAEQNSTERPLLPGTTSSAVASDSGSPQMGSRSRTSPSTTTPMLKVGTGFSTPSQHDLPGLQYGAPPGHVVQHRRHRQCLTAQAEVTQARNHIDAVADVVVPLHQDDVTRGDAGADGDALDGLNTAHTTKYSSRIAATSGAVSTQTNMTPLV